jgi:hypothetical protein
MSTSREEQLDALAGQLREAAYFCTKLEDLESHCEKVAAELDRLAATPKAGVDREVIALKVQNILATELGVDSHRDIVGTGPASYKIADALLPSVLGGVDQQETQTTKPSPSRAEDSATETAIAIVQSILSECGGDFHCCAVCGNQDDDATRHSDLFILLNEHPLFSRSHSNEQSAQGLSRAELLRGAKSFAAVIGDPGALRIGFDREITDDHRSALLAAINLAIASEMTHLMNVDALAPYGHGQNRDKSRKDLERAMTDLRRCKTCDGRGEVGGFDGAENGFRTEPCPLCASLDAPNQLVDTIERLIHAYPVDTHTHLC